MSKQDKKKSKPSGNAAPESKMADLANQGLEGARQALAKLPILGPALWLYARDPSRKFTFLADMDWLILPPVILDQCRLYSKNGIPFAFFTWARVSDAIDARLRTGVAKVAPHEWKSGPHVWLIDLVSPFGQADEMIAELLQSTLTGESVKALLPDPHQGGKLVVREWPAVTAASETKH